MTAKHTIFFVVVLVAPAISFGGDWPYQNDGENAHDAEWAECRSEPIPPMLIAYTPEQSEGTLPNGNHFRIGPMFTYISVMNPDYTASYNASFRYDFNPSICSNNIGIWIWKVTRVGDTSGMSYWLAPSNLSPNTEGSPDAPGSGSVDAADAGVLFRYWGSPIADLNGDAITDAADAGVLFESWSGDRSIAAVPEPSTVSFVILGVFTLTRLRRSLPLPKKTHLAGRSLTTA